jgi:hypothetical protein
MRVKRSVLVVACGVLPLCASGQESVNKDLDACIRTEQLQSTAKGAAVGALVGFLSAHGSDKKQVAGKRAAAGAVIGGAAGFITAYYKAVGTCYEKNPSWRPESQVQRSGDYEQVKAQVGYRPEMGPIVKVLGLSSTPTVKPGAQAEVIAKIVSLTPDGSEQDVVFERKLFVQQEGGKEEELPGLAQPREQRKLEAGAFTDQVVLPIPSGATPGTKLRYQISVAPLAGGAPSTSGGVITIN